MSGMSPCIVDQATHITYAFSAFMEPRSNRQDKCVRDYDMLREALGRSEQLDCIRNFLSVHVCSTITLTDVLAGEFFNSGRFVVQELVNVVTSLLEGEVRQAFAHVGEALRDLIHIVKLAIYGPCMIIFCFFSPKKAIMPFYHRVSQYQTPPELREQLAAQAEALRIAEAEREAYGKKLETAGVTVPALVEIG